MKYYVVDRNEGERVYAGPYDTVSHAASARRIIHAEMNPSQRDKVNLWVVCDPRRFVGSLMWPKCDWCQTELVKEASGAGKCPCCGAMKFK